MLECYAFQNFDKSINAILLFGLVRPVVKTNILNYDFYCNTIDQFGNVYKIYSEYDPALKRSATIAIKVKEHSENDSIN